MKFSITLIFLLLTLDNLYAENISEETKNLSRCEGVYIYAAHLAQMNNNEGLAKNLLFRASNTVTTYLFLNEKGGRVSGEVMEEIKSVRRADKPNLDANPYRVFERAGVCDSISSSLISKARSLNKTWDGRDFNEWQQMMFATYLKTMAIK